MIIVKNSLIPFPGFKAITLWPFIFVRRSAWAGFTESNERHERIHGRQQLEILILLFFLWYGIEWFVWLIITGDAHHAYRCICFEKEAYHNQNDASYLKTRRLFSWLSYLGG